MAGAVRMKPRVRQDFILGAVVIGCFALFLGTVVFLYPRFGDQTRTITVQFPHADGVAPLKPGSPVMLSGSLQVGAVTAVRLERADVKTPAGKKPDLVITVDAAVATYLDLYEDCVIGSDQPPVGGGGTLVIRSVGTPGKHLLDPSKPIAGQPAQSFAAAIAGLSERLLGPDGIVDKLDGMLDARRPESLVGKIGQILDDVKGMSGSLRDQLTPGDERVLLGKLHRLMDDFLVMTAALKSQTAVEDQASMFAKLNLALDQLSQAMTQANGLLADNRPTLSQTLMNIESMTRTLDEDVLGKMRGEFDKTDPQSLISKLHKSMNTIQGSLENVESMTDTGRVVLASNRPVLQKTIDNIQEASDAMRIGMQELIVAPWKLLDKPASDNERRKIEIFEAARRFAEAASTLDNTVVRLEAVMAAAPREGPITATDDELKSIRELLKTSFDRYKKAEDYLFESIK